MEAKHAFQALQVEQQCNIMLEVLGTVSQHREKIANLPCWTPNAHQTTAPVEVNGTRFGCTMSFRAVEYGPGQVARKDSTVNGVMLTNCMTQEDRKELLFALPAVDQPHYVTRMLKTPPAAEYPYDSSKRVFAAGFAYSIRLAIVIATHEDAAKEFAGYKTMTRWRFSDVPHSTIEFVKHYAGARKTGRTQFANADELKMVTPTHVAIVCPHKMPRPPDCIHEWWHIDPNRGLVCESKETNDSAA